MRNLLPQTQTVLHEEADFSTLDRKYDWAQLLSRESVIILVGTTSVCELLDRYTAMELQHEVDRRGAGVKFRRAVVLQTAVYMSDHGASLLRSLPTISLGSPSVNPVTARLLEEAEVTRWDIAPWYGAYLRADNGPKVALWGGSAGETRETVRRYIEQPLGLTEFLQEIWR